jgi:hypothetical protein
VEDSNVVNVSIEERLYIYLSGERVNCLICPCMMVDEDVMTGLGDALDCCLRHAMRLVCESWSG